MEFDSVVKKRHSARSFSKRKVSWKFALDAIELANHSPFAGNHNHLKFILIEDSKTISKISKLADQPWIAESSLLILVCSDDTHLENLYGERGRVYSRQQAGSAIQTILLKLADLNLSSCWVGAFSDEIVKESLGIPQHIQIEAILPIGYENKSHSGKKPRKKALDNVVFWEKWDNGNRPTLLTESEDLPPKEEN
ncbi:MAG: nitroreductase family protein [Nanoarchaeota archaeon]|nr:nitroreductase family protein [Nanoarchaeota archaeon]